MDAGDVFLYRTLPLLPCLIFVAGSRSFWTCLMHRSVSGIGLLGLGLCIQLRGGSPFCPWGGHWAVVGGLLGGLTEFIRQVVVHRRDEGILGWIW